MPYEFMEKAYPYVLMLGFVMEGLDYYFNRERSMIGKVFGLSGSLEKKVEKDHIQGGN